MSKMEDRLFNYKKMLENILFSKNLKQREISDILDLTTVHVSNVKQEKSALAVEEVLELVNRFDLCMDDFVKENYQVKNMPKYNEKNAFQNMSQDEILMLVSFLSQLKAFRRNKNVGNEEKVDFKKVTGASIRKLRIEQKISEKEMADLIYVKQNSYQNIERGFRGTSMDNYILIAKRLGVPVSKLFEGVIKNKKYVVLHEIWELFADMTDKEKREMRNLVRELAEIMEE